MQEATSVEIETGTRSNFHFTHEIRLTWNYTRLLSSLATPVVRCVNLFWPRISHPSHGEWVLSSSVLEWITPPQGSLHQCSATFEGSSLVPCEVSPMEFNNACTKYA